MEECLSVKPKTDPTITRPSTSTPRPRTYKPKKKGTKPTSITSRISTSNSSHSHGNEAQHDDENTNMMEIDPTPSSQHDDTPSTSHELNRQSVGSNNPPSDTANNHQTSQAPASNPANEETSRRHSARLASVINPESSPNQPPPSTPLNQTHRKRRQSEQTPDHSDSRSQHRDSSPLSTVPSDAETNEENEHQTNNPEAENESIQPNQLTTIHPSHDSTTNLPAPPIDSNPERSPENFTIITSKPLYQIIAGLANTFRKGRVSKPKWHQGCHSFEYLLKLRLDSPEDFRPPATAFIHNTAEFNYDNWTKEIAESSQYCFPFFFLFFF